MKYLWLLIGFIALMGCKSEIRQQRIVCDNFKTPWSFMVYMEDSVIYWREKNTNRTGRKMLPGEICRHEKRKVHHDN